VVAYLRVVDFIDVTGCEWFLEFGDGAWVRLDLSNAVVRLRDRFAVYVGELRRPVHVVGVCGEVLKVLEVYGQAVASGGGLAGFCA